MSVIMRSLASLRGLNSKSALYPVWPGTCTASRLFSGAIDTLGKENQNLVKSRDYESYVVGLLQPPTVQSAYFALRAFHVEISSIQAKEASIARMRMRWWFDAIQSLYSPVPSDSPINRNPTLNGLHQAVATHNLTQRFLERMVETRMRDLEKGSNGMFDTIQEMIYHYEKTNSTFLFLNLECCGVFDDEADKIANCIGVATGIVNMVRSIGLGHVGIPRDLIKKYGIEDRHINDPRKLIAGEEAENRMAIRNAIKEMAMIAGKYLSHARLHQGEVPKEGRSALLPAVSTIRYLEYLKGANYDVFEESIRDIENTESFTARSWRLSHFIYLGRAHFTGVF